MPQELPRGALRGEGSMPLVPHLYSHALPHRRNKGFQFSRLLFLLLGLFVCCGGGARGQDLSTDAITGITYAGRASASVPVESGSLSNTVSTSAKFYVLPFFGPTSGGTWVRNAILCTPFLPLSQCFKQRFI
eukprot:409370-Prorocentrum_minimum.AAC.2